MFNPKSVKDIKVISKSERQTITLVEDTDQKKYLKRIVNSDKREIYKTLQKINSPSIPQIYYIGFDGTTTVYEQYIEGISLTDFMDKGNVLTKKQIHLITKQILSALQALHESRIIHKDIKPDNILIDKSNHVWLIDYDIARIYREDIRKDTEVNGTFGYAPIEQYGMLPTDFKTDIYSFGVTLKTLLDYSKTKGYLYKIAEKCKRLDPSQRYSSVRKISKAIFFESAKYPIICLFASIVVLIVMISNINLEPKTNINKNTAADNITTVENNDKPETESDKNASKNNTTTGNGNLDKADDENAAKNKQTENAPSDSIHTENSNIQETTKISDFDGAFNGFDYGTNEEKYKDSITFSHVCIFSTDTPWEHLLFIDDMNKKGQIKMGTSDSIINADIILDNGVLSVNLTDNNGHSFSNRFQYNNQYEYTSSYSKNLRKNADFICYDFDGDGSTELLIGLNEGSMGDVGGQFYNNFNYCIAWCIKYDQTVGFTQCNGEMFSKGYSFSINSIIRKLNVAWEDFGDVTGYTLDGYQIIENY